MPLLEGSGRRSEDEQVAGQLHRYQRNARIDIFGKMMSISDDLMWRYYELLSGQGFNRDPSATIASGWRIACIQWMSRNHLRRNWWRAFMVLPQQTRREIISKHDSKKGNADGNSRNDFPRPSRVWICRLIVDVLKFAKSTSEARRLIAQGAVKVDGKVINDVNFQFQHPVHQYHRSRKNRIAQADKNS